MFRAAAEAMAMREGLSLVNRIGCTNVIMESDSTETIEACVLEILLKPLNHCTENFPYKHNTMFYTGLSHFLNLMEIKHKL
jgi:ribonuclease HI